MAHGASKPTACKTSYPRYKKDVDMMHQVYQGPGKKYVALKIPGQPKESGKLLVYGALHHLHALKDIADDSL